MFNDTLIEYLLYNIIINLTLLIYLENVDYTGELDASIDFLSGDFSGVSRCTNITILDDVIVEDTEVFNVILKENSSRLEIESSRNTTRVIIMEDNDCKHIRSLKRTLPWN